MSDILCISTTDWDEIWGSRQQIMLRLVKRGHRVLFVERQVGPEQLLRSPHLRNRKFKEWRDIRLHNLADGLWRWQPTLLPPGRYYNQVMNRLGQKWLARQLRPVLKRLGFNEIILWLYPPQSAPLIGLFDMKISVYHCIERFAGIQKGRKREVMLEEEAQLLRRADLVFTHSDGLRKRYEPLTQRPIRLIPSAADVAHFQSSRKVHPDILHIPQPRMGVVGTLDERIDIEMLSELARLHKNWHLILIGHIRTERVDMTPLFALRNVHSLGKYAFKELPELLNGMDVNLVPYVLNELTRYISPLKIYEYLAVGKPIVSVDLPEVHSLSDWITIVPENHGSAAERAKAFGTCIQRAMDSNSPEREYELRKAAWDHDWDERVNDMWQTIDSVIQEN